MTGVQTCALPISYTAGPYFAVCGAADGTPINETCEAFAELHYAMAAESSDEQADAAWEDAYFECNAHRGDPAIATELSNVGER